MGNKAGTGKADHEFLVHIPVMPDQAEFFRQELLREIKAIPPEYFPNLLKIIRVFRETALFGRVSRDSTKGMKAK